MKRFMILSVLVVTAAFARATDYKYLVLQQTDGTVIPLSTDGLRLTFSDGNLVASDGTTVSLSSLSMMCFSEDATAIETISYGNDVSAVDVYTVSGVLVGRYESISAAQQALHSGLYVMKNNGGTQKIAVK